jgi:hypothetical protein
LDLLKYVRVFVVEKWSLVYRKVLGFSWRLRVEVVEVELKWNCFCFEISKMHRGEIPCEFGARERSICIYIFFGFEKFLVDFLVSSQVEDG